MTLLFALNHMTASRPDWRAFLELAQHAALTSIAEVRARADFRGPLKASKEFNAAGRKA
jgi:hypothetical protein